MNVPLLKSLSTHIFIQHAVYKLKHLYPWSLLWSILLAIDPYITCFDNRGDGSGWQNHAGIHWNEFLHHYKAKVQKLCGKKKEAHPKLLMEWSCWASKQIGLLFSNFIHSIFGTAAWPRLYSGIETSKCFTEGKFISNFCTLRIFFILTSDYSQTW